MVHKELKKMVTVGRKSFVDDVAGYGECEVVSKDEKDSVRIVGYSLSFKKVKICSAGAPTRPYLGKEVGLMLER